MKIRNALESDLARIVEIYNAAIPSRRATADTVPVTVDSRRAWFDNHDSERRPLLVLEKDGEIAAWMSFENFYGRPAYQHTAELSIYVAPEHQRQRLGRYLLEEAVQRAPNLRLRSLVGYIFAHNESSVRLFTSFGFREWGRLPDVAEIDGCEYSLCIFGKRLD